MGERVYELRTVRPPKFRVRSVHELSASSLRFKCNSLLHLNRGLPRSAVYDLSTVRHMWSGSANDQPRKLKRDQ